MNVWDAVTTQHAVRRFSDRQIAGEDLDRILEAGRRSPSSNNDQRWGFILITDRGRLRDLAAVGRFADHLEDAAAAIAFVTPDDEDPAENESIAFDLGQAVQSMMLVDWELGIGSCHVAVYEPELTRSLLGYPEGSRCDYLISLGYRKEGAEVRDRTRPIERRPIADLRHDEHW